MSITDLHEALRLVAANPEKAVFAGQPDPALIEAAEQALRGQLPPTYREFVSSLGAGSFGSFEVYGVINSEFARSSVPNGVWLTLTERHETGIPDSLVIVGSTGDGDYYCIEASDGNESPVFVFQLGYPPDHQRKIEVAKDFGAFFLLGVRDQL